MESENSETHDNYHLYLPQILVTLNHNIIIFLTPEASLHSCHKVSKFHLARFSIATNQLHIDLVSEVSSCTLI